jgi:hypothetical protein
MLLLFAPFQEDVVNATITNIAQVTKAIYYFYIEPKISQLIVFACYWILVCN